MFVTRGLSHPREFGISNYNEDALYNEQDSSWFGISDGVGSALFSDIWSRELSKAVCQLKAVPNEPSFDAAMSVARQQWHSKIDWASLDYFRKKKFSRQGGSFATLLYGNAEVDSGVQKNEIVVRLWCYGDCNAFHIRNNQCIALWPWNKTSDFGPAPPSLCSTTISPPDPECWHSTALQLESTDSLLLATDALAEHLVGELSQSREINWLTFLNMSQEDFSTWIEDLRNTSRIERDDTTFLLFSRASATDTLAPETESPQPSSIWMHQQLFSSWRSASNGWDRVTMPMNCWPK